MTAFLRTDSRGCVSRSITCGSTAQHSRVGHQAADQDTQHPSNSRCIQRICICNSVPYSPAQHVIMVVYAHFSESRSNTLSQTSLRATHALNVHGMLNVQISTPAPCLH